jgi:hypothetical protein
MGKFEREEAERAGFKDHWFEDLWWRHRFLEDDYIVPIICVCFVGVALYEIWKHWV